jgi:hypothetical protein
VKRVTTTRVTRGMLVRLAWSVCTVCMIHGADVVGIMAYDWANTSVDKWTNG